MFDGMLVTPEAIKAFCPRASDEWRDRVYQAGYTAERIRELYATQLESLIRQRQAEFETQCRRMDAELAALKAQLDPKAVAGRLRASLIVTGIADD